MANLVKELFDWTWANSGYAPNIMFFCGHLPPEAVNTCAVLLERGGNPSKPLLRGNVGEYAFQVLARGETYMQARLIAQNIHAWLWDRAGMDLGDWQVWVCEAEAEPQFLGFDSRGRYEFSTNYTVRATQKWQWDHPGQIAMSSTP